MANLSSIFKRFRSDEGGAFAMIFALMAIVLVATSGAVVDFTSMQGARTRAQVALDSAALALQPSIYNNPLNIADIKTKAQNLLTEQINNSSIKATVNTPTVDIAQGQLDLSATITVPMNFVSLVGVNTLTANIVSVATRKKLNLEVAMVLDNSGSMGRTMSDGNSRMQNLQTDATCAANILFYGVKDCATSVTGLPQLPNVKFGIVPFNSMVNVGTGNANAAWLDRTGGANTFDNANFDDNDNSSDVFSGNVDRIALFSKMKDRYGNPMSWGGCVEARIHTNLKPYDVTDVAPTTSDPDTLFTPLFAPDEPDSGGFHNSYIADDPPSCAKLIGACTSASAVTVETTYRKKRRGYRTSTSTSAPSVNAQLTTTDGVVTTGSNVCTCDGETLLSDKTSQTDPVTTTPDQYGNYTSTYVQTEIKTCNAYTNGAGLTPRELQERLCKYNGAQLSINTSTSNGTGPNGQCPASSIQPLTDSPSTIKSAVNSMVAGGNTDIHEGAIWGYRVLSPGEPFTEGKPYDAATSKVMIVMTDGENTYSTTNNMNGSYYYVPYGYPYNNVDGEGGTTPSKGRLGAMNWYNSQYTNEINSRFSQTCTNAKAAGITIYTIGLATSDTSNPAANKALLQSCASETSKAFFPTSSSDLTTAFVTIANQLADLRLEK